MSWLPDHSTLEEERDKGNLFYRAEVWAIHKKSGQCLALLSAGSQSHRQWGAREGAECGVVNGTLEWCKSWAAVNKEGSIPPRAPRNKLASQFPLASVCPCSCVWNSSGASLLNGHLRARSQGRQPRCMNLRLYSFSRLLQNLFVFTLPEFQIYN